MRPSRVAVAATLLCLPGCLYAALGAEPTADAAARLRVGLPLSECLAALARGGTITTEPEMPIAEEPDRTRQLATEVLTGLQRAEATTGRRASFAVVVNRHWGFAGFGVVHLFVDDRRELVGHHMQHIN